MYWRCTEPEGLIKYMLSQNLSQNEKILFVRDYALYGIQVNSTP